MCAHDHDRFRLPSASPPQKSEAGKKESTDRRLSQAYQRCVTPSSNSTLDCRRNVARTAEGGFATHGCMSKSAKVVLGRVLINRFGLVRLTRCPLCPDSDQILQRNEMARFATVRFSIRYTK